MALAGRCFFFFLTAVAVATGIGDIYSNSHISPNSAKMLDAEEDIPSIQAERTSKPDDIVNTAKSEEMHRRVRSASPALLLQTGLGDHSHAKRTENLDGNRVDTILELSARSIRPTRTSDSQHPPRMTGEARGAPRGRSLSQSEPRPTATTVPSFVSLFPEVPRARQASPDIQDIITGIVKLLNGNVNVQANTSPAMGRPLRPLSTRINNRGPPRITDVPPLPPDFDLPTAPLPPPPVGPVPPPAPPGVTTTTKMPTPYPFEIPPQNTSPVKPFLQLPDQIIPANKPNGFRKPITIPAWTRPQRRPPLPQRRPVNQQQQPYQPSINVEDISLTSEEPPAPLNETQEENNETADLETVVSSATDEEMLNYEKNKDKTTSKMEKTYTATPQINSTTTSIEIKVEPTPTLVADILKTQEPVVGNLSSASSIPLELPSNGIGEATPVLESSIQEILSNSSSLTNFNTATASTTATEELYTKLNQSTTENLSMSYSAKSTTSPTTSLPNTVPITSTATQSGFPYYPYRPRPGIVLDDTEYTPGAHRPQPPPIVTARPQHLGDVFDVTVSAIQGPGGQKGKPFVYPVEVDSVHVAPNADVITSPNGSDGFVSIDGKRTYLNLFGEHTSPPVPSLATATVNRTQSVASGHGVSSIEQTKPKPTPRRPVYNRRPSQPHVRIDTCIVGDESTCDAAQSEVCRTEAGVSSCHCRPGHARRKHRDPCRPVVALLVSLRVDRFYERRLTWAPDLVDHSSETFQQLAFEAGRAIESAMSMTPFSDDFMGAQVNGVYQGEREAGQAGVFVNLTIQLGEGPDTSRPAVRGDIQRHLLGVIQRRGNNIGHSALWVDSPPGAVSSLQDLDECSSGELHDCHALATCTNVFGGFRCECSPGTRDPWADNRLRAGRMCERCPASYCNNRGQCKYQNGHQVCECSSSYYGSQCEVDGEVLGVAIGASVAAVIIIVLTLICLIMWSRKWSREQKAAVGSPVFGYMATAGSTIKTPVVGGPPYQLTLEDRVRWAQIADVMAQANLYAPEPVTGPTRPSSAMFGFPTMSMHRGTLPPVPLPRLGLKAASVVGTTRPLESSSSSEEEDRADLLGRNFQVPRPKSRSNASIANQSGIYYDVDYDQNDIYKQGGLGGGGIPMSTYTPARPPYYRH